MSRRARWITLPNRVSWRRKRAVATLSGIKRALAILAIAGLAGCQSTRVAPLWPGSKYTEGDRSIAMLRALAYIDQSASKPANFAEYGTDYVYCFYSIAASARDPELSGEAERIGRRAAKRWAASHAVVTADANADDIADLAFGWLAASQLGQDDGRIKPELRKAAVRFTAVDYLQFDPAREPPPSDIPEMCPHFRFGIRAARRSARNAGAPCRCSPNTMSGWMR